MDRIVHGVAKSQTQLSDFHFSPGLSCGMFLVVASLFFIMAHRILSYLTHELIVVVMGSSFLTRDRTLAPCTGSVES